jgi:hypothetical protein
MFCFLTFETSEFDQHRRLSKSHDVSSSDDMSEFLVGAWVDSTIKVLPTLILEHSKVVFVSCFTFSIEIKVDIVWLVDHIALWILYQTQTSCTLNHIFDSFTWQEL